jgi:hypothetical protein
MIDRPPAGLRCHTRSLICAVTGNLPRPSARAMAYAMEHLGRLLIVVDRETGFVGPVFSGAIERWCESREIFLQEVRTMSPPQ